MLCGGSLDRGRLPRGEWDSSLGWQLEMGERSMDELVPVLLGAILGAVIWLSTSGKLRVALSLVAVIVSGTVATVASGEYHESWIYLLLDLGEATFGLVSGYFVAARLLTPRAASRSAPRQGDAP